MRPRKPGLAVRGATWTLWQPDFAAAGITGTVYALVRSQGAAPLSAGPPANNSAIAGEGVSDKRTEATSCHDGDATRAGKSDAASASASAFAGDGALGGGYTSGASAHERDPRLKSRADASSTASSEGKDKLDSGGGGVLAEVAPLLRFAAPTLCIAATSPLLSLVDTSVVGLGARAGELAAMAPATALSDGLAYTLTFLPMAVTNLVALHIARGHPHAAGALRTYQP